jgi:guanyl-specific ribonuclease Sa
MNRLLGVATAFLVSSVISAQAEPIKVDMKPGLWQNKMSWDGDTSKEMQSMQTEQMKTAMEEMKKQFADMPPEQRKQMEAIMAQSGMKMSGDGISFQNDQVQISPQGTNAKTCVTQLQIDRGELPDDVDGCKTTLTKVSTNRFKSTHVCTGDQQSSGESEVVFDSPKHYAGTGKMNHEVNGKTHVMSFKMEGTWLSSDCGDIKPAE